MYAREIHTVDVPEEYEEDFKKDPQLFIRDMLGIRDA